MTACEAHGVCPRLFLTPWAAMVQGAMSWWEQGALGLTFIECPAWLHEAFAVIGHARSDATRYRSALIAARREAARKR